MDELYLASIKESSMVKAMWNLHPSSCMIGADTLRLSGDIDITMQQHVALTSWLNSPNQ